MDIAEQTASDYSDTVYFRAGLHSGYGSAQRMRVKRGHLLDGSGAWYCDEICPQYADCRNGGDLFLHVLKASGWGPTLFSEYRTMNLENPESSVRNAGGK